MLLETDRLILRQFTLNDADFVLELVNTPSWLKYIGDRGVKNLQDARVYIMGGPVASYRQHGFGLYLVIRRDDGVPIGLCGLLKRDTLEHPDVGFALMPAFERQGFGFEAANAVLRYGRDQLGLTRMLAVTQADNAASIKLLKKLGLAFDRMVTLKDGGPELMLFASDGATSTPRS